MKSIKSITVLLLVFMTITIAAQDYKFISKNLHLMSDKELMDNEVQISGDVPMYDVAGNVIQPFQINDLMMSGNFIPQVFGNEKHQAVTLVFRLATKEEKEAMQASMQQMGDPNANFVVGQMATDFIATDINGNTIMLSKLKGKVVVLNFWFTQCKPCVIEMPKLNELVKKYKDVVFISVTFDKKEDVKKFLDSHQFNYTHITENESILADYNIAAFPSHLIIDQKGEIIFKKVGDFIKEMDIKIGLLLKQ